jgi:hypothetical protein
MAAPSVSSSSTSCPASYFLPRSETQVPNASVQATTVKYQRRLRSTTKAPVQRSLSWKRIRVSRHSSSSSGR